MLDSNPFVNFRNGVGSTPDNRQPTTSNSILRSPTPLVLPPSPGEVLQCERRGRQLSQDGFGYGSSSRPTPRSPFAGPTNPWQQSTTGPSPPHTNPPKPVSDSEGYTSLHAAQSINDSGDDDEEAERDLQARAELLNRQARKQGPDNERVQALPNVQLVKNSDLSKLTQVGRGSFGEVWEVSWMGTRVAAKYLLQHKPDPTMMREVEMLRKLTHPNVIRLLGICMDPPIILTEFCSRGSLYSCIRAARNNDPFKKKKLNWLGSLRMLEGVASGMMFLHSQNTLHGDLRTPNILLERDYSAKIADFGLAKVMQSATDGEPVSKTTNPRWLAPEVYQSHTLTKEGDVYSFGIIMLEMLTWSEPYPDMNDVQVQVGLGTNPPIQPEVPLMSIPQRPYICLDKYIALMRSCWNVPAQRPTFAFLWTKLACMRRWTMLAQDIPRVPFIRKAAIMSRVINHWRSYKRDDKQPAFTFTLPITSSSDARPPSDATRTLASWSTVSTNSYNTTEDLILPPKPFHYDPYTWRSRESSDWQPVSPMRGFSSTSRGINMRSPPSSPMMAMRFPDLESALDFAPLKPTDSEERHENFMQLGHMLDTLLRQDPDNLDPVKVHTTINGSLYAGGNGGDCIPIRAANGPMQLDHADSQHSDPHHATDPLLQPWNSAVINNSGQLPTVANSIPAAKPVPPAAEQHVVPPTDAAPADVKPQDEAPAVTKQVSTDMSSRSSSCEEEDGMDIAWGPQFMNAGVHALAQRVLMDMQYPTDHQEALIRQLVDCAMEDVSTQENALMVMCKLADLDAGDGMVKTRMLHEGVLAACCNALQGLRFLRPSSITPTSPLACCMAVLQALWHVADSGRQETSLDIVLKLLNPPPHLDLTLPQPLIATHKSFVLEAASIQLLLRLQLHHTPLSPNIRTLLKTQGVTSALELLCCLPADSEQRLVDRVVMLLSQWAHDPDLAVVIEEEVRELLQGPSMSAPAVETRLIRLLGLNHRHDGGSAGTREGDIASDSSTHGAAQQWAGGGQTQPLTKPQLSSPYQTAQPPPTALPPGWSWARPSYSNNDPGMQSIHSMPQPTMMHGDSSWHHHTSSSSSLCYTPLQDISVMQGSHSLPADVYLARNHSNCSVPEQVVYPGPHSSASYAATGSTSGSSNASSSNASSLAVQNSALSNNGHRTSVNLPSPGAASSRPTDHAVIDPPNRASHQRAAHGSLVPWSDSSNPQHSRTSSSVTDSHPAPPPCFLPHQQTTLPTVIHSGLPIPGWYASVFDPSTSDFPHLQQPYLPGSTVGMSPYASLEYHAAWQQTFNGYPTAFQPPFHTMAMTNAHVGMWLEPQSRPTAVMPDQWTPVSPSMNSSQSAFSAPQFVAPRLQLPAPQSSPSPVGHSGPGRPSTLSREHSRSYDRPHTPSTPNSAPLVSKASSHPPHPSSHSNMQGPEAWQIAASTDTQGVRDQDVPVHLQLPSAMGNGAGLKPISEATAEDTHSGAREAGTTGEGGVVSGEDVGILHQPSQPQPPQHAHNALAVVDTIGTHNSSNHNHHSQSGKKKKFVKPGSHSTPAVDMKCKVPFF